MQLVTRWRAAATISTNSCMILSGWAGLGWAGRSVSSVSSINMLHGPSAPLSALCVLSFKRRSTRSFAIKEKRRTSWLV